MHIILSSKKWWASLLLIAVTVITPVLPYNQPHAAAAFSKGQGQSLIHVKLSPDVSNATVQAVRQKHFMDGTPDTYTLTRSGSTYSSPSSGSGVIKVPLACDSSDNVLAGSFDITVSVFNGGTVINGTSTIIGQSDQSKPLRTCGGDEKSTTVTVTPPKSSGTSANSASLCGTLTYKDPSSGKTKPWQANSTIELSGTKSATGHADSNGNYCFRNLPSGTYALKGTYAFVDDGGTAGQSLFSKSGIKLTSGQAGTFDNQDDPLNAGATKTDETPTGDTPTCENSAGPLGWIVCGIIDFTAKAVDGIYGALIEPLLKTDPLSLDTGTKNYQAWSTFRIIGDVFLVIALLVIVFGQSLGGGLIDAYSAKKILPRLLAASIFINLSYYLVAIAIDVSNVVGGGIQNLIMAPFHMSGVGIRVGYGAGTIGTVGAFSAAIGGLWAVGAAGGVAAAGAAIGGFALEMLGPFLLFVLIPAVLLMISIVAILLFRQGLIILLVLTAPVAFALYCLPNTEQYFRRWWDLFLKTLLIYPIISIIFAIANVLSITITQSAGPDGPLRVLGPLKVLIGIIALLVPLFLIPFAFKLAGGVLGRLHDVLAGGGKRGLEAIKGNPNDPNSLRNRMRGRAGDATTRTRERAVSGLSERQKELNSNGTLKRSRFSRRGLTGLQTVIGAGDLEARRSKLNKDEAEKRELKTGYGPDSTVRALFAKKMVKDENGDWRDVKAGEDGIWRSSVNGNTFSDYEVAQANALYGRNLSAAQSAIDYEVGKAGNEEEYANFLKAAPKLLADRGYNEEQINGAMKGVGFKNQAKRLDLKHSTFSKNPDGSWSRKVNHAALAQDAAENFGSYPISNMKVSPIDQLGKSYDKAQAALADDSYDYTAKDSEFSSKAHAERTVKDVASTAEILKTSMMRSGGGQQLGEGDEHSPIVATGGTGAAGHVNEAITRLVEKVSPTATRPQRGGDSSGGSGLTLPGDNGFNLPPSQQPRG